MLIATSADVNARDLDDATYLMIAARNNHTGIAQLLIADGAVISRYGSTALMLSVEHGHEETAQLLRDAGAR